MDTAGTTAGWLSFFVTAVGLGSLITQASSIQDQLDPYRNSRTLEHLGTWIKHQPKKAWFLLSQPPPVGPVIYARLVDGFCGSNTIGVSRLPSEKPGKATWTAVLAIFHELRPTAIDPSDTQLSKSSIRCSNIQAEGNDKIDDSRPTDIEVGVVLPHHESWDSLQKCPLTRLNSTTCIIISRTTLITILALCNSRIMFRYSDASGHRASYASYCGHFYIDWPIAAPAVAYFHPHDSHSRSTDVYPAMFCVRVDRCVQMMAGVIASPDRKTFQCAFPGRKPPGTWILVHQHRGFPGAHGSRHLYNMMGGKVYEVDFCLARQLDGESPPNALELHLPSTEKGSQVLMIVPEGEQKVLEQALDCLPWSSLSWSIHRGLRDILVAYAKPTMDKFRRNLAERIQKFIKENPQQLEGHGWAPEFVQGAMPTLAASSVMAGSGNSGDSVRVVTDAASLLSARAPAELDETTFWRETRHGLDGDFWLSANAIVALTKCFVLEWSVDFDYQMYHDLPPEILFR
ncbi:hypothetical protein ACLMJK_008822 [Lecanora helva]